MSSYYDKVRPEYSDDIFKYLLKYMNGALQPYIPNATPLLLPEDVRLDLI